MVFCLVDAEPLDADTATLGALASAAQASNMPVSTGSLSTRSKGNETTLAAPLVSLMRLVRRGARYDAARQPCPQRPFPIGFRFFVGRFRLRRTRSRHALLFFVRFRLFACAVVTDLLFAARVRLHWRDRV